MTVSEVQERITEIDEIVFKVETGQIPMSWNEYKALEKEADELMVILAQNIAPHKGCTYEEAYEARQKVRHLSRIEATVNRHLELHPEAAKKEDPDLIKAFSGGSDTQNIDEASARWAASFEYMFENAPRDPNEKPSGGGFLRRLFTGRRR